MTLVVVLCFGVFLKLILATGTAPRLGSPTPELAQDLANPLADLITILVQANYDHKIGPEEGRSKWTVNVKSGIPFSLSRNWNLIRRTIVPIIAPNDFFPGAGSQSRLDDVKMSLFFSPKTPLEDHVIWEAGPLLQPTTSKLLFGIKNWESNPTPATPSYSHSSPTLAPTTGTSSSNRKAPITEIRENSPYRQTSPSPSWSGLYPSLAVQGGSAIDSHLLPASCFLLPKL